MIPWPNQNTKFPDWANSLKLLEPQIDILPLNPTNNNWRTWGNQVAQSTFCQTFNVPRTDTFKEWHSWAYALIRALGTQASSS